MGEGRLSAKNRTLRFLVYAATVELAAAIFLADEYWEGEEEEEEEPSGLVWSRTDSRNLHKRLQPVELGGV